jgi:hypothetical protein
MDPQRLNCQGGPPTNEPGEGATYRFLARPFAGAPSPADFVAARLTGLRSAPVALVDSTEAEEGGFCCKLARNAAIRSTT